MTREPVRTLCTLAFGLSAATLAIGIGGCGGAAVKQDAKSGPDAIADGARTIKLNEDGEGDSKDTVSYPGGDRVDWKAFEIEKKGDLEITLKWTSPRPNLDLAMNILDDTFNMVKRVPPASGEKQTKVANIPGALPGKYYVQVYASERKDAGDYTLDIKYTATRDLGLDTSKLDPLPNPPRLPGIPGAAAAGGTAALDKSKPKGDKANPCQAGEQCPPGSNFKRPACPDAEPAPLEVPCPAINPACPEAGLLAVGVPCPPKVIPPRAAKIIERSLSGQDIIITLDKGTNQGIAKGWTGVVFVGKSGSKPLTGSDFTIFKVTEDESYGKIRKVSMDDLGNNSRVELKAPPQAP
jgi:hypothetical protein